MSDNIKVVVKVRPLISREVEEKQGYFWRVRNNTIVQLDHNGRETENLFTFDKVYDKNTKTKEVYDDVAKPIVEAAVSGFNGTIFAYGQTSSGKTYTMTGNENSPGIIPLAVLNLFNIIKQAPNRDFLIRVSYIEIYNETLKDLLQIEKKNIKVHETCHGSVKVDVTEKVTASPEEVLEIMKEGEANRQTGATNMNEESSRSHSIFQITIESREHVEGSEEGGCVNVSQLNLVDLAGSERAGQTGATGLRFKEGTHINKSLSCLALVIKQLSEDPNRYVNFRDSKLTRILQNSLGGNAKTSIICAVTPASIEETVSTLKFANRAKAIKNKPQVNAVATDATMIQSLTKELSKLQSELAVKRTLLQTKENLEQDLQKQIASLQKLILNGFGQRSSKEELGAKRKLQPPRRVTISTLHNIEEEPVPSVPKFCTPSLKYNPMALSTEFIPIQNTNKLTSVPEEARMITPPPGNQKTIVHDEIIELDSDDDNEAQNVSCSPYHSCYVSSKTPPCVLRKNAKLAEKSLKDIVELTEREKMYTPNVVELLEKHDKNTAVIEQLQEKINDLLEKSREKDLKIEELKTKIEETENKVNVITSDKTALETKCKNYDIQITDWEVSYETLSQKSKNRERDLLSLLEEQRSTKAEDFCKTTKAIDRSLINLLDMSKDISLVNSDNESTTNIHDEPTLNVHELVKDLQSQIIIKNQTITDLESNISNQQQKIDLLEKSTLELQTTLENFNIKISSANTENLFLKSTIDSLTSSIENEKKHLENANKDIKSYNDTIQELQIKLIKKDSILDVKTNESVLENMIANEQNFIANNENMKNIILSFKIALNSKNKEIDNLKSTIQENLHIKELIDVKEKQIITLMTEIEKFKEHLDENMSIINRLMKVEQELTSQLSSLTKENDILLKQNEKFSTDIMNLTTLNSEYKTKIEDFQTKYEELNRSVEEKSINEQTLSKTNEEQLKLLDDMSLKIIDLEKQLNDKVNKIKSIHEEANVTQEQTNKLQLIIQKLHSALQRINSNTEIVPENMNNQESVICYLNNEVDALEAVIMKVTDERDKAIQVARELNEKLSSTTDFHNCELSNLQSKVNETNSEFKKQSENLLSRVSELTEELESKKSYIVNVEVQLNDAEKNNENLRIDILSKEKDIASLKDQLANVIAEIEETKSNKQMEIATLNTNLINEKNSLEQLRLEKFSEISLLEEQLSNATFTVETNKEVIAALKGTIENRDKVLLGIFKKVYKLAVGSEIEILQMEADSVYEQIIQNLDKVSDMIILLKTENDVERNEIQEVLTNAKKDLDDLTEQNLKLLNQLKEICEDNDQLLLEIQKVNSLNEELTKACESLKDLNVELRMTSKQEIQSLEKKAEELAIRLEKNENLMKEKMDAVMKENERLKDMMHCRVTESTDFSLDCSKKSDLSDSDNIDSTTPQSLMTICFNKIMKTIQSSDADYTSLSTTSSKTIARSYVESETQTVECECESLSQQLYTAIEQKNKLTEEVNNLKVAYNYLLEEREEVRKEIQSLVEPASELQKKIYNHRTNLSTLTATTYAENKLLHSQLKVLKHHHTRYINVCQRDLPAFKSNLNELMTILKGSIFLTDKHSANLKRYSLPDVLDSDTSVSTFKNESTFDADLLMLDTNVTLTTADNTLVGHDQTSFETSQIHFDTEVCQTNSKEIDPCLILQIETLTNENFKLVEQLSIVQEENSKLKGEHQQSFVLQSSLLETSKSSPESVIHNDTQCSPNKITTAQVKVTQTLNEPEFCKNCENFCSIQNKLNNDVINLTQTLKQVQTQKEEFEQKFNHLNLEMPSIDALRRKLSNLEKDHQSKAQEIDKLSRELKEKHKKLKDLQEENDTLSNQVFENISEIDSLKEEFDKLKEINSQLIEKNTQLEMIAKSSEDILNNKTYCSKCEINDEIINSLQNNQEHSKLGRSLSDSDSSSRYNKICTLQSELNASKEDCKKITEEVATIKNHLERNNISMGQAMDLDESLEKSNIFTFTKDFGTDTSNKIKCEIETTDLYLTDKSDCLNFYIETTGADKENLNRDVKIIDIMKMLYSNLITKHGNEVENLSNKLIDFEESKLQLQTQLHNATMDCSNLMKQLHQSDKNSTSLNKVITKIRENVDLMQKEMSGNDEDKNLKLVTLFKEDVLKLLDIDFELSLVNIFGTLIDNIVNKYHKDLSQSLDQYEKLQNHMETVMAEFKIISENHNQIKLQLTEKEAEYNLLKTQKERIHEISNAVTLDIVKKEQELNKVLSIGCNKLSKLNITCPFDIHDTVPLDEKLSILFESIVSKVQDINENTIDKQNLISELSSLQNTLEVKEQTVTTLNEKLTNAENNLQHLQSIHENLVKICENKDRENEANINVIKKINLEIESLKEIVLNKEVFIQSLENKISQETIDKPNDKLEDLKQEYEKLKHINELINKEKDVYADELMKAQEVICRNKAELERMTSDIIVLRESVNDNVSIIESLTLEAKTLMEQNLLLKKQFEEKCRDCSRLEMNIKTHEKSVEIQSKMITRLKNQKEDDDKSALDKDRSLKEITDKFNALQEECENLKKLLEANKEAQLSELDAGCEGRRNKVVVTPQDARRRRQSFYDSRRVIIDDKADNFDDHNKIEAMFGSRGKPDDLFDNVDEDSSNRSTPVRLSRGRDSLLSGQDQSDKEEDHSRPSSVAEVRRRRQSIHDSHRASLAREPHLNHSQKYSEEVVNMKPDILGGNSTESDVNQLREKLVSLQSEMEELRERNRELDDECETCAQYLHERDEQCRRLKKENTALERQLAELNEKLNCSHNRSHGVTPSVAHASVNTDADWANLHSVVVDRMSFDAEVEKNKRMTRTIEELRCNKQELKNTIAKMQRALEKNAAYKEAKELEATKAELGRCKLELSELQTRYRELDEECETCAQYLRERDDQCRKLREAKHALEARVLELQEAAGDAALAARRKRRTAHDLQRHPPPPHHASDAHTDTGDDLLSYQVERDEESTKGHNAQALELKRVKNALDKVLKEKAVLENKLLAATMPNVNPTMYVATGSAIVQNQQITDVMKENQKLKKINAKLVNICKKRGKPQDANIENEEPSDLG